ncbi:SDR family NAD(P)-dependent oxidoreductase [uncultured Enterovirga sp.]|uniref:SDR family NAD(P)-dependent oxidoreductase n=1 Tax=uncultured Enterovirga sp. TaxID=2026352 RepID=UPI0035C958B9
MSARFAGKVAIVTGAASGIGLATAMRFGSEGASVVIADLNGDAAIAAAGRLEGQGASATFGLACDVASEAAVEACVAATIARFGRLDVVVNNAGMMLFKPLEDFTGADWTKVLGVDLLGAVHFTRQAFLHMSGGAIVNVSSVHAERTTPLVAPYAAAKAAVLSLTRSTAIEGRAKGIRCNAVLPGAVDTPMLWENPNVKSGIETIDKNDVGRPEDIAAAIAYLASDDALFVTGAALQVDGGRLGKL